MKRKVLLVLAMAAVVAAMVPRERREVKKDDKTYCSAETPCAWSVYKPIVKYVQTTVTNTYCECPASTDCVITEDDGSTNAYIHRCRKPGEVNDVVNDS